MTSPTLPPSDTLVRGIRAALVREIEKAVEVEVQEATKRLEKQIRDKTASVACGLVDLVSFERVGMDLVIRVKFE